ncbi:MAG: hypothetical protein ABI858_00340 [Pseudoxanthomonas sp.]
MAIVQLIYISRDPDAPVSDFWYFDRNNPTPIKARSASLAALKEALRDPVWNAGSHWMDGIAKFSWPSENSFSPRPAASASPIIVAFALSWILSGPAGASQQPDARYWIVQPDKGNILMMKDSLKKAGDALSEYVADQAPL